MVSSISGNDEYIQQMMAQMMQKMSAADTDVVNGLSKNELSAVDAGSDVGGSAFLQSLNDQFDSLDVDSNGQLSSEEISSVKPVDGPMGPPPGMKIGGSEDDEEDKTLSSILDALEQQAKNVNEATDTSSSEAISNLMDSIMDQIIDNFSNSFSKEADESKSDVNSIASNEESGGTTGISFEELSSINSKNKTADSFVKDLMENFSSYDSDGDGQLSKNEMKDAMKSKDFSTQDIAALAKSMKDSDSNLASGIGNFLGSSSATFIEKMLNNYKTMGEGLLNGSNLTNMASAIFG